MSRPVRDLPGLGPVTAGLLADVGIDTEDDLAAVGAVEAYRRLRFRDPQRMTLNALWGLHSALTGVPWTRIDAATKARLKAELEAEPDA